MAALDREVDVLNLGERHLQFGSKCAEDLVDEAVSSGVRADRAAAPGCG